MLETKNKPRMSQFTREQVIGFPDSVKARIAYGVYEEPEGSFDAALVLGGRPFILRSRAEAAAKLYHAGRVPLLIPTGGVEWDSEFGLLSEAQITRLHLLALGVPEEHILLENAATTTHENMQFCRKLLRQRFGGRNLRIAVVSTYHHIRRAVALANAYIPEHEFAGIRAEYPLDQPETFHLDPELHSRVTKECRCLWSYVHKGLIPDFPI